MMSNKEKNIKLDAAKSLRKRAERESKWTIVELLIQSAERLEREVETAKNANVTL